MYVDRRWLEDPEEQKRLELLGWFAEGSHGLKLAAKLKRESKKMSFEEMRESLVESEDTQQMQFTVVEGGIFRIGGNVGVGMLAWHTHLDAIELSKIARFHGFSVASNRMSFVIDGSGVITLKDLKLKHPALKKVPSTYAEAKALFPERYPVQPQPQGSPLKRQKTRLRPEEYRTQSWESGDWVKDRWWLDGKKKAWELKQSHVDKYNNEIQKWCKPW